MPDGREWNGILDDTADIGNGLIEVENCSLYISNMLQRRPGFGDKIAAVSAAVNMEEVGTNLVTVESNGGIRGYDQSTGAATTMQTGYTVVPTPNMASGFNRIYISNGTQAVKVVSATLGIRDAGIVAPTVAVTAVGAAGTVGTIGTHLVRYRYKDTVNNRLSNPSEIVSITTVAGTQTINVGVTASPDGTVTNILVEITPAGASAFYIANTGANATGTVPISISDDNLVLLTPSAVNGDTGHAPPPQYTLIQQHRQRLWMMDPTTGLLAWSQPGFPESFDTVNNGRIISLATGDTATAIFSFFTDLYICGQRSMMRLVYTTDPGGSMALPVVGSMGCYNARCFIKTSMGEAYGWGRDGMWRIASMQPARISKRITETMRTYVDPTQISNRFVEYDPVEQVVLFFFCLQGETVPRGAFAFYPQPVNQEAEWVLYKYRQGITAGCYNSSSGDRQRTAIADANGYLWRLDAAANDGGAGSTLTVTSATTTVINGTNTAVVGMIAYRSSTAEERLITAAASGAITVSPAFAIAPTAGEVIYCGSIRQRWVTQWFTSVTAADRKRPTYLKLMFNPQTTNNGTFIVRFYLDFSTAPTAVTSQSADTWPTGISIINGTDITVDVDAGGTDGYIPVPIFADFNRSIRAEIIAEFPGTGVRLYDFQWGFTNKTQEASVPGE